MDENLSLMMVPYKPKEIPDSTDLNIAPLNWLRPIGSTIRPPQKKSKEKRSKKTKMKSSIVANHYLKSHFMGSSQKTLNGVNAVADADTIKNLIKLGKELDYYFTFTPKKYIMSLTQAILFLKSMSERGGSDIERL